LFSSNGGVTSCRLHLNRSAARMVLLGLHN
jgi:hypothetical protein